MGLESEGGEIRFERLLRYQERQIPFFFFLFFESLIANLHFISFPPFFHVCPDIFE